MQSLYGPFSGCLINALPLMSLIRPGPLALLKWDFSRAGMPLLFATWPKTQVWQTLRTAGVRQHRCRSAIWLALLNLRERRQRGAGDRLRCGPTLCHPRSIVRFVEQSQ